MSESVVVLNPVRMSAVAETSSGAFGRLRTAEPFTLWDTRNTASPPGSSTNDFKQICSTLISEGGTNTSAPDQIRSVATNVTSPKTVTNSTIAPVLSVRPKLTFGGITNRGLILPVSLDIFVVSSKNIHWQIVINPTLNGSTWTSVGPDSIADYNTDATTTSGGQVIASGFAAGTNQSKGFTPTVVPTKLRLSLNFDGTVPDIMTLQAISLDSPSSSMVASLQWSEFF